jgi:hypothetical protein
MSEFQTLLAVVIFIFVLSVIVQAAQEVLKSITNTKAAILQQTVIKFMGDHLTLAQVEDALHQRGLDITALEHFNKEDFRHLLDGIAFAGTQLQGVVKSGLPTLEETKNNVAAAFDAARASFQKAYTKKNKIVVIVISFIVVLVLNANLIMLYEDISADQVMAQAIVGKADKATCSQATSQNPEASQQDLNSVYKSNRNCIKAALKEFPILVRTGNYADDWKEKFNTIAGLLLMGILVSLGAPFWNDVLKGMMGVNNALNTGDKKASS